MIALVGALTMGPLSLTAQPETEGWVIDRFEWEGGLDDATVISVENGLGDVRARGSEQGTLSVLAVLQYPEDDRSPPMVDVVRDGTRITVRVLPAATPSPNAASGPRPRVDLSLFVPPGIRLVVSTQDGLVEAKGLENDVEARSIRGDLRLVTSGSVRAMSERGDVTVHWTGAEWATPPSIETVTGAIELWMPRDANALVAIETAGLISTDYTLEVEHRDDRAAKRATARLGNARTKIDVRSARGDVRLLRSPLPPANVDAE